MKKLLCRNFFRIVLYIITATVMLNFSSCIFTPERKVLTYDLGVPKSIAPQGMKVYIMPFMNDTETAFQMVYRTGEFQLEQDPYNRWIQTPGMMVTAYLRDSFRCTDAESYDYTVFGQVVVFEINLEHNCILFSANYKIKSNSKFLLKREVAYRENFIDASPENFAKSMSKAAAQLADSIRDDLIKLKVDKTISI